MEILSFQHIAPPLRLFQGPDSLKQLGPELDRAKSTRAVIFCGSTLAREGALLDRVRSAIGHRSAGTFAKVRAHSPLPSVMAAAEELKRLRADAAIALGGGSAIVTARAASILVAENRDASELCTTMDENGGLQSPRLLAPKLPQFAIPTTPTTAVVKAGSAVFDPAEGKRLALFDPKTRAQAVFIDPQMLQSAPRALVASASLTTLTTAIEGLVSRVGNPIADALLMHSVRLLAQHLVDPDRHDGSKVRSELVLAAILCGQGTDHTGGGITTALSHAIGARHDIENGIVSAILLPHAMRFNADAASAGLAKLAGALGLQSETAAALLASVVNAVQAILNALGVPGRLRDLGVRADSLPAAADLAIGDWFLRGNPRRVRDASELQTVLEQAW